mmetsp:Transcript_22260/g.55126  ORF Transcript_22260/g.55126 Transcript_22260/m.55126 type:complete len:317 (+) Transcript_22260:254-1204(+)
MEEPPFNRGNENRASAERKDLTLDSESFRQDLSRLLYRPQPRLEEAIESSLSVIPWELCLKDETSSSALQAAAAVSNDSKPAANQALSFPSTSYLDLRRHQNLKFADDQCSKANPSAWKQALQLVPDHVPSLVGYGKFCLQNNKLEQAEQLLKDALSMDPNHSLARRLLSELNEKRHQTNRHKPYTAASRLPNHVTSKPNLKTRESSAYQDALLERQLLASPSDDGSTKEEEEEALDREYHKKSRRHHKRRKKERKRRRKHYDSSSENASEDSLDESDDEKRRRKRKKHRRERKRGERRRNHRKHRRRSKSDSSAS